MSDVIRIQPKLKGGIAVLREFRDYKVVVDDAGMPMGVELIRKVG